MGDVGRAQSARVPIRLSGCASVLAILSFFATILWIFASKPDLPKGLANGTYVNSCCGEIELRDGRLPYRGSYISYAVKDDKVGAFILPDGFTSVFDGSSLQFERNTSGTKLRLDSAKDPTRITLPGRGSGPSDYTFVRVGK